MQRGDIINLTRDQFFNMWKLFDTYDNNRKTSLVNGVSSRDAMLYAWGLRLTDHQGAAGAYCSCAVIYPKKFLMMKLKHGI